MVTGSSKELLEHEIKPLIEQFMRVRGLELSEEKTKITHIEVGFDFLGQTIRKYKGKLIIKPSKKSVKTFLNKIRVLVKSNKQITAGKLIERLNPKIQSWANYHRHVVSSEIFSQVDCAIYRILWRWAKRRHPHKGGKWLKAKYFQTVDNRNWVFTVQVATKDEAPRQVHLFSAFSVKIRRHLKIQNEANPYDPRWEPYFEQRLDLKTVNDLKGRRKLLYLWREQKGLCPICQQKITKLTGWHSHHIVWRVNGGKDGIENRVLLHPNCHKQIHNRLDLAVVKPGTEKCL